MFTKAYASNQAPKAIGPYSPAVKLGDFVYLSGQLPLDVDGNLVQGKIQEQTYQVLRNLEATLAEMNLEMRHIVKTTVFLTNLNDFDAMNEIYATYFSHPYPARSTVEVKGLAKGALVEIEAIVIDTLLYEQEAHAHHHHHEHGESCGCGHDHDHNHAEACACGHDHSEGHSCDCDDPNCSCKEGACDCQHTHPEETECENGVCFG
jgi:2-iminobutanoate/2-iminopropanoate deaminase